MPLQKYKQRPRRNVKWQGAQLRVLPDRLGSPAKHNSVWHSAANRREGREAPTVPTAPLVRDSRHQTFWFAQFMSTIAWKLCSTSGCKYMEFQLSETRQTLCSAHDLGTKASPKIISQQFFNPSSSGAR